MRKVGAVVHVLFVYKTRRTYESSDNTAWIDKLCNVHFWYFINVETDNTVA